METAQLAGVETAIDLIGIKAESLKDQRLLLGGTVILNFEHFSHKIVSSGEFIQKNFKTVSGKSII